MCPWNSSQKSKENSVNGAEQKKQVRTFLKSLAAQALQEKGQEIIQNHQQFQQHALEFLKTQAGCWGAFRAHLSEISLDPVVQAKPELEWVYPKMVGDKLKFCVATEFEQGPFGILEPVANTFKAPQEIQGLLIPGLGFNKNGCRLGRGKGFYDKYLEDFSGVKVGVCWSFQVIDTPLPCEDHDVKMDYLLTDHGLIKCS